jgi:hypothetical protein
VLVFKGGETLASIEPAAEANIDLLDSRFNNELVFVVVTRITRSTALTACFCKNAEPWICPSTSSMTPTAEWGRAQARPLSSRWQASPLTGRRASTSGSARQFRGRPPARDRYIFLFVTRDCSSRCATSSWPGPPQPGVLSCGAGWLSDYSSASQFTVTLNLGER